MVRAFLNTVGALLYRLVGMVVLLIKFILKGSIRTVVRFVDTVKTSRETRTLAKWLLVGIFAVGIVGLIVSTVGYFVQTDTGDKEQKLAVEAVVTDPFTLQVAAYLKPEHAREYVAALKKMNIDAYWTETAGNNKNWYQVRVSHFPDKKSAIAYGEALKSKGIIDDFFVANY